MGFKKIIKTIKGFFAKHWEKWTIFAFLAILIYIGFVFYNYVYKSVYASREVAPFRLEIKKAAYNDLMNEYLGKEEKINQINNKIYLDPFK